MTDKPNPGPLPYGTPVTLAQAKQMVAAAEAEAVQHGWPMVIAVVDTAGLLVALHRMDNAQNASIEISQQKARTAVDFKRPTRAFEDAIAGGGLALRLLGMTNMLPLEGGLPIERQGAIIGAIGVSGMSSTQDAQVARAALTAIA